MNIEVGKLYKFIFNIASTDPEDADQIDSSLGGIYFLRASLDWDGVLLDGTTVYENIYKPLGYTDAQFAELNLKETCKTYYKLQSVHDEEVILYMPAMAIMGYPDASINQYARMMLGMDLGVIDDPSKITAIKTHIQNVLKNNYGIAEGEVSLVTHGYEYLTIDQMMDVNEAREARKNIGDNPYTNLALANVEINRLKDIIAGLEAIVIASQ